jgi:hypothetical protein
VGPRRLARRRESLSHWTESAGRAKERLIVQTGEDVLRGRRIEGGRFQGLGPALRAQKGGQAASDFVLESGLEPIETYAVNAGFTWPPEHSNTH